jgi:hypothetical protein
LEFWVAVHVPLRRRLVSRVFVLSPDKRNE